MSKTRGYWHSKQQSRCVPITSKYPVDTVKVNNIVPRTFTHSKTTIHDYHVYGIYIYIAIGQNPQIYQFRSWNSWAHPKIHRVSLSAGLVLTYTRYVYGNTDVTTYRVVHHTVFLSMNIFYNTSNTLAFLFFFKCNI